jgi:hypothetical protein
MNLPSLKPQNMIAAAALLAPMVMVQTVRMLFGGAGPDQASAQMLAAAQQAAAPVPANAQPAQPVLTSKQKAAMEHMTAQRDRITIFVSPFNHLAPRSATVQSTPTVEPTPGNPEPRPAVIPPEVRELSLGALMANDKGPFAVISGRVRTVGDVIVPGWTVTAIDTDTRRVTITSDDGTSVTLTQNR